MVIFHLIDSLKRGGAETLLHQVVTNLKEHKSFIITLTGETDFTSQEMQGIQTISLGFTSLLSLPLVIYRLRKLVSKYSPDVVHAHLPLSSLVARLSTPSSIKLLISVHNKYSDSFKKVSPRLFFLEKKLHTKRDNLLFVSDSIRNDYDEIVGIKGTSTVLYNFIADKYFAEENQLIQNPVAREKLRLVSVGSLKKQKNFDTLIKAMGSVDAAGFTLDIFGEGPERKTLEKLINDYQLNNITLKGAVADIENHLKNYDAYILASRYEGFGIAPLEAAAIGLPLLLSGIDVFKEVANGFATYFTSNDEMDIVQKLNDFKKNCDLKYIQAARFKTIVSEKYSRENYINKLLAIYNA